MEDPNAFEQRYSDHWVQAHKGQFNTIGLIKNRMGIFIRIHVLG